ncbi:hypothetical protein [Paenibacillus sp. GP183]|uniref:hypothetical protein n=1 Tax=Paenibacillus sp. GP183 TaxID=1882751 RepID=UPI000897404F|nr:hypothetical protein [Paenibacillus sp. GP183]SEB43612.1 hypothetical protein SAMN05443246_0310 [Paenibacillus sp. GP183]
MNSVPAIQGIAPGKLDQILKPGYQLCKEDVIWILEFIKKKVAEEDPNLAGLSQPQLLRSFRYFTEIAMMLIHRKNGFDQEADRLKRWLCEAAYGPIE